MTFTLNEHYLSPNAFLWQGRVGKFDAKRMHQAIQLIDLKSTPLNSISEKGLVLIGFACDEGIKRNLGRVGAAMAPDSLRTQLAKLPYLGELPLYDVGNIQCINEDLNAAQSYLAHLIEHCHELGHKTLLFGGGHETAWGHYQGLKRHHPKLSIMNFDAHFDLRKNHISTSGTPFLQIADDKNKLAQSFDYFCYGIQKTANTLDLFDTAKRLNVSYLKACDIVSSKNNDQLMLVDDFIKQSSSLYVSICMDVFNACVAPGVSAPAPLGLMPWHVIPILNQLIKSKKVVSVDIVELSPPFDKDELTARLASSLAAEVIYSLSLD